MTRPIEEYYPPDKYDYVPVCVFRTHERVKGGRLVKVTRQDLQKTADNHNELWEKFARASPMSKGHTLDEGPSGGEVPERDQPDTAGVLVRFYVDKVPEEPDADFLFATWCRPKDQKGDLEKYVSLSPEYYPGRHLLYPVSLLKSSAPELVEMPALPLHYAVTLQPGEEPAYRLLIDSPFRYSSESPMTTCDKDKKDEMSKKDEAKKYEKDDAPKKDEKADSPEDKAMADASKSNEKGQVQDKSDLSEIKSMLAGLQPLIDAAPKLLQLAALMDEEGLGEGDDDLMKPAVAKGDPDTDAPEAPEKEKPEAEEKDSLKASGVSPVKFESGFGSATNGHIPSFTKDKDNYKMDKTNEVAKYKAEVEKMKADLAATQKVAADLYKAKRRADAEKAVAELETVHKVQYASEDIKKEDVDMLAKLDEDAAKQYVEMAKVRYAKKLPNSESVKEVAKYAVEQEPDLNPKDAVEAQERALKKIKAMAEGKK